MAKYRFEHSEYEGAYEGWTNQDTWFFKYFLDNDHEANEQNMALARLFAKHDRKGNFELDEAVRAVKRYLLPYMREPGTRRWREDFNPKAVDYEEVAEAILRDGIEDWEYQQRKR